MEPRKDRPKAVGEKQGRQPRGDRRPYSPPTVRGFGRKLPAFAPPSWPQKSPPPPFNP